MIHDHDVRELLDYQAPAPVLSVYLNTEPREGGNDAHRLTLRNLLKEIDLPKDTQAVLNYIEREHDWSGRSVVMFSCAADGFFRAYPLAVGVRSRARVGARPFVKPIANLQDAFGGYGVVLIDKQGARLFIFNMGELQEQEGWLGDEVRHTKRGGVSTTQSGSYGADPQTDSRVIAERNIKEAAELAVKFFSEKKVRRILIGGTEDNVAIFRNHLPKAFQSLVVGAFPIAMTANQDEILTRALEVGETAERRREEQLVQALVTSAAKGHAGVITLADTLKALHEGRVQTLVIRDGYRAPGCRCTQCGYLMADAVATCPFCGGTCETIPDAVELAVSQVMAADGDIEVLRADQLTPGFDQIGAILRY